MNPLVAVTTGMLAEGGTHGQPQVVLYTSYMRVLEAVGLAPVRVTPAHTPAARRALLESCAGLVLTGGEDVDPRRYGEEPIPELGDVLPPRDEAEEDALALALARDLPVLGICRGCQVLNVFYGGTLYQDLAAQRPGTGVHEQGDGSWDERPHLAHVEPGTRLHGIVGGEEVRINTFHHQAIREPGPGLVVSAWAEDGVVEAVEDPARAWLLGVQWHPERQVSTAPPSDPDRLLFAAFADAVRARLARESA